MIFVNQKSEIIELPYEKDSYLKMIELVGRVCWHSYDRMTDNSYIKFCKNMARKNHGSVSEHGTIYLYLTDDVSCCGGSPERNLIRRYEKNRYSIVKNDGRMDIRGYYVTTNYRVILENDWQDDLKYACDIMPYHERRVTVKFSMDRIGSQSVERHRGDDGNSFLQESTRYCNYARDKFGNEVKITPPEWVLNDDNALLIEKYEELPDKIEQLRKYCKMIAETEDEKFTAIDWWLFANMCCEYAYLNIIRLGHTAEEARAILPVDLNTELFCTFSIPDWIHFFDLRVKGTTGRPHPDIYALAKPLYDEFIKRGYISE